jgi:hypothetical protein
MTVTVTLHDGDTDEYMRYGDTYAKGDEKQMKRSRLQGWFKREAAHSPQS